LVKADRDFFDAQPVCFQTIILGAQAKVNGKTVVWFPSDGTLTWISAVFRELDRAKLPLRVLARLQMRGNFIWSKKNPDLFLDGELFAKKNQSELQFPSGDHISGGNVDMWFWLVAPA
jgi:hypothetical protein